MCIRDSAEAAAAAPRRAAIGASAGASAATGAGFDLGVDGGWFGAEDGDRDAAIDAVLGSGPTRRLDAVPGFAAVQCFPKPGAGAAAVIAPPGTPPLQGRGVQDIG